MPLIFIAAVLLITGLDLLISWNKFEMFFKILGVEILIAVIVWVVLTLVFSGRTKKDSDNESAEDEE
jgi:xanthine/uracil permease